MASKSFLQGNIALEGAALHSYLFGAGRAPLTVAFGDRDVGPL